MPLGSLQSSPRILPVPVSGAGVAPVRTRVEPFVGGQLVQAQSATDNATITGANLNLVRATGTNGRYIKFALPKANVTPAAQTLGFAGTRDANGNATDDITVTFGAAAGDIALSIPVDGALAAAEALAAVLLVNGVPYGRILDAGAPVANEWCCSADGGVGLYTIVIGVGATAIRVGTEFEFFIPELVGVLAKPTATGLAAGTALTPASTPVERRLGVVVAGVDTAGRTNAQLANVDIVLAGVGIVTLINITK
jgi:hypothetical protein